MHRFLRSVPFLAIMLCLGLSASAQRPSLTSLIAQSSCTDTTCMNAYAASHGFCPKSTGEQGTWLWFTCEHVRDGAMDVLHGTGLLFFPGNTSNRGYVLQTCAPDYARALTDELERLGFRSGKTVPTGALYASPAYKGIEVMRTEKPIQLNGREVTSWAFMVLVR